MTNDPLNKRLTLWKCLGILVLLTPAGCDSSQNLLNPSQTRLQQEAPDSFSVVFATSAGDFQMMLYRDWYSLQKS